MITFDQLLNDPPVMKTTVHTLDDGREYLLHDLPAIVFDDVYRKSQEKALPIRDAAYVAVHAMLGCKPQEDDVSRAMEQLGSETILDIFKQALDITSVTDDNVDAAKKLLPQTSGGD